MFFEIKEVICNFATKTFIFKVSVIFENLIFCLELNLKNIPNQCVHFQKSLKMKNHSILLYTVHSTVMTKNNVGKRRGTWLTPSAGYKYENLWFSSPPHILYTVQWIYQKGGYRLFTKIQRLTYVVRIFFSSSYHFWSCCCHFIKV